MAVVALLCAGLLLLLQNQRKEPVDRVASRLDSIISPKRMEQHMKLFSSVPHRAGTEENRKVGDAILNRLRELGLHVSVDERQVNLWEPKKPQLFITSPDTLELDLAEKVLEQDPYSRIAASEFPFFAYSPDADLESEVIYANFGTRDDYAVLKKQGIQIAGKIALVRAQGICRSMKNLVAEEEGVAGLLLYPELHDQGMFRFPYPDGPHINPWVAQRGSLLKYFLYPGDPLNAESAGVSTLPQVPAFPISGQSAIEIFRRMQGKSAPEEWRGLMPVRYSLESGPARVRMVTGGQIHQRTIRNLFATFPGKNPSEPSVMVGNHYDAWVYGAADPGSGTAVVLETAEAFAQLQKQGWLPERSITFVFWDAEEYGLIGSSSWVSAHIQEIRSTIVTQFYVDSVRSKLFRGYVSPVLRKPLEIALQKVNEPEQGRPFFEIVGELDLPGFSDDTAPFTGFAGIPTAQVAFGTYYGMYHSLYDNLNWMDRFSDPGYRYRAALAKILTLFVAQFAGDTVLPYNFAGISASVREWLAREWAGRPGSERFAPLFGAMEQFDRIVSRFETAKMNRQHMSPETSIRINQLLLKATLFFSPLPQSSAKPSFGKHNLLEGPSETEGCVGEWLPLLQRAIRSKDQTNVDAEIRRLSDAFRQAGEALQEANAQMQTK